MELTAAYGAQGPWLHRYMSRPASRNTAVQPSRYCLFEQRLASGHEKRADCGCDGYPVSLERNDSVTACSTFVYKADVTWLQHAC